MSQHLLGQNITPAIAEELHRRVGKQGKYPDIGLVRRGLRIARARDPRMMQVLEQVAEVMHQMGEAQYGETRRSAKNLANQSEVTVVQMWREAYRLADEGMPDEQFGLYYLVAAEYAGV